MTACNTKAITTIEYTWTGYIRTVCKTIGSTTIRCTWTGYIMTACTRITELVQLQAIPGHDASRQAALRQVTEQQTAPNQTPPRHTLNTVNYVQSQLIKNSRINLKPWQLLTETRQCHFSVECTVHRISDSIFENLHRRYVFFGFSFKIGTFVEEFVFITAEVNSVFCPQNSKLKEV